MREKNERSKTADRHRRHWLPFICPGSQSEFARHENRLLVSRLDLFCLSDVAEDMRVAIVARSFTRLTNFLAYRLQSARNSSRTVGKSYQNVG